MDKNTKNEQSLGRKREKREQTDTRVKKYIKK